MGIHGDKSQQERDWVLNGKSDEKFFPSEPGVLRLLMIVSFSQNSNMEKLLF